MKEYRIVLLSLILIVTMACEKVIKVDLKKADPEIVIEGIVDNSGAPAKVSIHKSVPFDANNIFPAISGASVKISDNTGANFTLLESSPGTYTNASLVGLTGRTYTLSVIINEKNYTASSTMPAQIMLDTILQDKITLTRPTIFVSAAFNDPAGIDNYYQFIETVNGKRNKTIFMLDDLFQDGGAITNELIDEDLKLKTGDTVQVEMQCIDKPIYRYLRGLEDLQFNNTVPANPETNISNKALGYFSAHTSQRKKIIIK